MKFFNNIGKIRKSKGISRKWISRQTGINYLTLTLYEHGKIQMPAGVLMALSRILQVTAEDIMFQQKEGTNC
ncbi:MAG TPA: helix-turn-helix transcriptional regulator [Clostridia bacterium]|nr:helix-turn-helix transcriptional regulator [Clostridia bacterium]